MLGTPKLLFELFSEVPIFGIKRNFFFAIAVLLACMIGQRCLERIEEALEPFGASLDHVVCFTAAPRSCSARRHPSCPLSAA